MLTVTVSHEPLSQKSGIPSPSLSKLSSPPGQISSGSQTPSPSESVHGGFEPIQKFVDSEKVKTSPEATMVPSDKVTW